MTVPSLKNAAELQRIVKETTGREVSVTEAYRIWHYLNKVLLCSGLWQERREPAPSAAQQALFD